MSEPEVSTEEVESSVEEGGDLAPSEEILEMADRIISRLNPPHRAAIAKMIHAKGKTVGGIFAGYGVFWWLTVLQAEDAGFTSIFFRPEFMTITIMAPALIFMGSLLSDFSRELGQLFPGLVSGVMFVLAILYVFEPVIYGLAGDIEMSKALWMTGRLAILCSTVLVAAKLLIDAWLLGWVKALMESYPDLDFTDQAPDEPILEEAILETEA